MPKCKPNPLSFVALLMRAEAAVSAFPDTLTREWVADLWDLRHHAARAARSLETPEERARREERERIEQEEWEYQSLLIAQSHDWDCYCMHCCQ
jgi:hypothetical protein